MVKEKKQERKPEETREADAERPQSRPQESHEGSPGYGQPPEEVRDKPLPDQKW